MCCVPRRCRWVPAQSLLVTAQYYKCWGPARLIIGRQRRDPAVLGTGAEKAGLEYCCGNVRRSLGWTGGRLDNCLPEIFLSEIWWEQHFPFVFLALEVRRGGDSSLAFGKGFDFCRLWQEGTFVTKLKGVRVEQDFLSWTQAQPYNQFHGLRYCLSWDSNNSSLGLDIRT